MESMNSKEYWERRFSTDWQEYSGNEQTKYFATILGEMLPEWLIHEVNENAYEVCDLGCAEGDALQIYKHFFVTSEMHGEDFSEKAVETANTVYPEFDFKVSNILLPEAEKKYPVVICSNVVEHFRETYKVISNICERTTRYAIILIPYREVPGVIEEHERVFHTKDIPMCVGDCHLAYAKSISCESIYYPYEQLLLVYAKGEKFTLLSEVVENVNGDGEQEKDKKLEECEKQAEQDRSLLAERNQQLEGKIQQLEEKKQQLEEKKQQLEEKKQQLEERNRQLEEKKQQLEDCAHQLEDKEVQLEAYKCQLEDKEVMLKEHKAQIDKYELQIDEYCKQLEVYGEQKQQHASKMDILTQEIARMQQDYSMTMSVLRQKDEYMVQAQELCNRFATGKLMGLNHFLFRIKGQLLKGDKKDRKEFWSWLRGRIKKTNRTIGEGITYNPWMVTREKLREGIACQPHLVESMTPLNDNVLPVPAAVDSQESFETRLPEETKRILQTDYTKYDVIILSVIDYNFRHQRPQHFATRFAANGHRVFYVNANFIRPDSISVQQENLYVVDFACQKYNTIYSMDGMDSLEWMKEKFSKLMYNQAIRDAVVIVDYPNWVYGADFIRQEYGFKIVTDYMDDYTGFLGTAEDFLKNNCIKLLQDSDAVVASSQFLYDVASKYTDSKKITIVRNGTEVEHFYQAVHMQSEKKERRVIGYYGAVSHWFAWDKVCYLADEFPECDVVIVGEVTEYREKLEKHKNIKLLGEKPYKELPQYLADFDVCLIPFDTSTDLIKATNPVKFYEYLSAGKKVVATEIPELMPFKNEYVYMSNDNAQFAEYVRLCLSGNDGLKNENMCIAFAKENDWQKRYECIESVCVKQNPKISIIVLTYNNLELNKKCIDSILKKTAYANYELIVVDNQSTDGTVEYLNELDQLGIANVKVILNNQNCGFAGGNNIGIKAAEGDYILLLNNDTVVTRGWLTAMIKHLENNPKYGMCNPVTNSIGNESMIKVEYHDVQGMHDFAYRYTSLHMNEEYQDVDRLPLFATLVRRSVIDKAGMLDEAYKVGMFEDDDFTEAVQRAGYQIVIVEDAFVHHVNNASFKKLDNEKYRKIFEENKSTFEKKWTVKWKMPKYREGVTGDTNLGVKI